MAISAVESSSMLDCFSAVSVGGVGPKRRSSQLMILSIGSSARESEETAL